VGGDGGDEPPGPVPEGLKGLLQAGPKLFRLDMGQVLATASSLGKKGAGRARPPSGLLGAGAEALHLIGEGGHPAGVLGAEGRGGGGQGQEAEG
jgi:hypothetical protein